MEIFLILIAEIVFLLFKSECLTQYLTIKLLNNTRDIYYVIIGLYVYKLELTSSAD